MKTRLILCFHNHQPVGNFKFVLREAFDKSYKPLLETLQRSPGIKFYMHFSGYLLRWIEENEPGYIQMIDDMVKRGDLKVLGGGYFEPIISNIPHKDAVDQFTLYSEKLKELFGSVSKGAWLAERVWEPHFPGLMAEAGVEFTFLDEYHFQYSGIDKSEFSGFYNAEHLNDHIKVLPISKKLRYLMPFHNVNEVIDHLHKFKGDLITMADDGEKFGLWPGTNELVYKKGWLADFLSSVQSDETIETVHFEDPQLSDDKGRLNIPACSYPEMMEWALSPEGQRRLAVVKEKLPEEEHVFIKGGFWSNFRVKYSQINVMVSRMLLSSRINRDRVLSEKMDLFRGQCNCAYWHGVFGGVYIPHLRHAVFEHLIKQDGCRKNRKSIPGLDPSYDDEMISTDTFSCFLSRKGGAMYEWDLMEHKRNILSVMERKEEYYHSLIDMSDNSGVKTIHDGFYLKDKAVELIYDTLPRYSFKEIVVEHGIAPGALYRNEGIWKDLSSEIYNYSKIEDGMIFELPGYIRKSLKCTAGGLDIENHPLIEADAGIIYQQWNLALSSDNEKLRVGDEELPSGEPMTLFTDRLIIEDKPFNIRMEFIFRQDTEVMIYPVRTVSNSESGVEEILQGISINIAVKEGGYRLRV